MLETGLGFTTGNANDIPGYSSGGQRLREIIKANPKKYRYIMVKGIRNAEYKVFFLAKSKSVKLYKTNHKRWQVGVECHGGKTLFSDGRTTKKLAEKLIKKCGV